MSLFEWRVAWRFLLYGKTQTLLILFGIIVGVAVQVFIGSLISGLQRDLVQQTVGNSPHVTLVAESGGPRSLSDASDQTTVAVRTITFTDRVRGVLRWQELEEEIAGDAAVVVASPTLSESGFAVRGQKSLPVVLRGVELEKADGIYDITARIRAGEGELSGSRVLIGEELAAELSLAVGDTLLLSTASGNQDRFEVGGLFDLGNQAANRGWVFLSFPRARSFFQVSDEISALEVQIVDVFRANDLADTWLPRWPELRIDSWQRTNAQLLTALNSQTSSSILIQVFVLIAVTLGISSVLAVSVTQKSKQIGILKAMGVRPGRIGSIFLIQGFLLGAIGSVSGVGTGVLLSQAFVFFVRTETGDPLFPIEPEPVFIVVSLVVATLAGMIASVVPARKSAQLTPMEVIRNG